MPTKVATWAKILSQVIMAAPIVLSAVRPIIQALKGAPKVGSPPAKPASGADGTSHP